MTLEIAFVLFLLVLAVILLASERLPVEQVSLLLVAALAASGVLSADIAFQGFASETVVMLACVMVLSRRLADSGLIARLTARLTQGSEMGERRTLGGLMAVSAGMSSVVTNTSTTAVLIPAVGDIARRMRVHPGRFLMPVAFASMMGGSATLVGTSTNLAASGALARLGLPPFGVFEFALVGLIVTIAGITLMLLLGPILLPDPPSDTDGTPEEVMPYMTTLRVAEGSAAVGKTMASLELDALGLTPRAIQRDGKRLSPDVRRKILAEDRIIVEGPRTGIMAALNQPEFGAAHTLAPARSATSGIAVEAVLMPGSRWIGLSLNALRAELAPDLQILALHRRGQDRPALVGRMRLKTGDVLLLNGQQPMIDTLATSPELALLHAPLAAPPTRAEGWRTLAVFLLAIAAGTAGLLPLSVALLLAVMTLVLTGRLSLRSMFDMINWRVLILIGGMSSFGVAMLTSGAATWLAEWVLALLGGYGPRVLLLGLGVLTILLTQPMSNAAAALTLLPVALVMAEQIGADPRPFVVMVTLSASLSFVAPFEPALLLVYGPGNYSFRDFPRAGLPLTILCLGLLLWLVPVLWPLNLTTP